MNSIICIIAIAKYDTKTIPYLYIKYDLFLTTTEATRNLAHWMAKERLISFIESDMHRTRGEKPRPPKMKEEIHWLYENTDVKYANDVIRGNAEKYLGIGKLLRTDNSK